MRWNGLLTHHFTSPVFLAGPPLHHAKTLCFFTNHTNFSLALMVTRANSENPFQPRVTHWSYHNQSSQVCFFGGSFLVNQKAKNIHQPPLLLLLLASEHHEIYSLHLVKFHLLIINHSYYKDHLPTTDSQPHGMNLPAATNMLSCLHFNNITTKITLF